MLKSKATIRFALSVVRFGSRGTGRGKSSFIKAQSFPMLGEHELPIDSLIDPGIRVGDYLIPPNTPWCSLRQKQSGSVKPASERSFSSTESGV